MDGALGGRRGAWRSPGPVGLLAVLVSVLVSVLVLGCRGPQPDPPPVTRASLVLENGWNITPWSDSQSAGAAPQLVLVNRFQLPAERLGAGSRLVLEGLWWRALVSLNGESLGALTGGNAPAWIPLGSALKAGENELRLRITPPAQSLGRVVTGGGLGSGGFAWNRPTLQTPPRLELLPAAHISTQTLPEHQGKVTPSATVQDAPEGAVVRFYAFRDGRLEQDLGSAPVLADGTASASPLVWEGPRWRIGDPALFQLVAVLEDAAGQVLDSSAVRTGLRSIQLADTTLQLDGAPLRLMAARMTNQRDQGNLGQRLAAWLPAGINAIEIHGELVRRSWLSMADELGLPVVVLHRCLGRCKISGGIGASQRSVLEAQDRRLVTALAPHPSLVLWMTEGPPPRLSPSSLWTRVMLEDPLGRLVVDHHLPGRVLSYQSTGAGGGTPQHSCQQGACRGAWIAEITRRGPPGGQMWPEMAQAFGDALDQGAVGGTIQTPRTEELAHWTSVWAEKSRQLGITPLSTKRMRASSVLRVSGLPPGQSVWLEAPWGPTVGAVAGASGEASLSLWHSGRASVVAGAWRQPVELEPGSWAAGQLEVELSTLQADPSAASRVAP